MQAWLKKMAKNWEQVSHQLRTKQIATTAFLDEKERGYVLAKAKQEGYEVYEWPEEDAERKRLCLATWDHSEPLGVALRLYGFTKPLHHPHILGSLMALNLRREELGDIWIYGTEALIFTTEQAAKVVLRQLQQVGSTPVQVEMCERLWPAKPAEEGREQDVNVASLRLDNLVSEIYGLRREEAKQAIERGQVKINHVVEQKPSSFVEEGDLLSVKKKGRAKILQLLGESKKKRQFVRVFVYAHKEG